MGYAQYLEMLGRPNVDPPGFTHVDFEGGDQPGQEGYATVWFENGVPVYCAWYVWSMDDDWFAKELEKITGPEWERSEESGGNGHYRCTFKKKVIA